VAVWLTRAGYATTGITARRGRGAWHGRDTRRRGATRAGVIRGWEEDTRRGRAGARFGGGRPPSTLKDY
jgi:hypothetical protein